MRTIAILPIKSFDAAKQRLSGMLASGARQALVQAMFQDTLTALRRVEGLDAIVVVTANTQAQQAAQGEGVELVYDEHEGGHSEAALIGVGYAVERGFDRALLVAGDTPLLDPAEIDALLDRAAGERTDVVIIPDRHGTGTNALLIAPPDAMAPAFGSGSRERHEAMAAQASLSCTVEPLPSLVLDVDTPEDLDEMEVVLEERRGKASVTRGALRQLRRSGARAAV